jgi:adenylate cyclase class 2
MAALVEREIKLRFASVEEARASVLHAGTTPLRGRRFQEDCLLDTSDERLKRDQCVLRIRTEGSRSLLTFKGPVQPGLMKVREELETVVADGELLRLLLERLGLHVWFRYQKYREEFTHQDVVIAVDETPVGTFIEIEGTEAGILRTSAALGRGTGDYILDSYYALFAKNRERLGFKGTDMVFDDPGRSS